MILLGILLLLVGWLTGIGILYTLGVIVLVIGVVLLVAAQLGHPVGGRSRWY